jgi:hypothetical protein
VDVRAKWFAAAVTLFLVWILALTFLAATSGRKPRRIPAAGAANVKADR